MESRRVRSSTVRIAFATRGVGRGSLLWFIALAALTLATAAPAESDRRAPIEALIREGRFADAERLALRTLAAIGPATRIDSLETARVLDLLVDAMRQAGKASDPEARMLSGRALAMKERLFGPDDPEVATSLTSLANLLSVAADFGEAKPLHERALAIRERRFGAESVEAARSTNNLGVVMTALGDYPRALELHRRTLSIRERLLDPGDRDIAGSLSNLAKAELAVGSYDSAQTHYERSLSILRAATGPRHPSVGQALSNLGFTLYKRGDDAAARERFEEALPIQTEALGKSHPLVAFTLNYLGVLLADQGDFEAARSRLDRALAIRRRALGRDHPDLAQTLFQIARVDRHQNRLRAAKSKLTEALAIYARSDLGPGQPNAAAVHHLLGSVHAAQGDRDRAVAALEEAARIWVAHFGPDHPFLAQVWCDLGAIRLGDGDARGSLECYERAERIESNALGPNHPDLASTLKGLSLARLALGDTSAALDLAARAEAIGREHVRLAIRSLAEREALRAAATREEGLSVALAVAAREGDPVMVARAWDEVIRSRALVLDEVAARHRVAAAGGDSATVRARKRFAASAAEVARLLTRGPTRDSVGLYRAALNRARAGYERAERELAARTGRTAGAPAPGGAERAGSRDVIAALPAGSALVAYALYEEPESTRVRSSAGAGRGDRRGRSRYLAFVASADSPVLLVVPLGEAARLDRLASRAAMEASEGALDRSRSGTRALRDYRREALALRSVAWDPVARAIDSLGGARTVFVVPEGRLALVPLWALPEGSDRFLIEAGWSFHQLACERDLLDVGTSRSEWAAAERLIAIGGPDYDAVLAKGPGLRAADGASAASATGIAPGDGAGRGANPCVEFRELRFTPLPGSTAEARDVAALWNRAASRGAGSRGTDAGATAESTTALLAAGADEATVKALAPGGTTLHFATHGFFLDGACGPASQLTRGIGRLAPSLSPSGPAPEPLPPLQLSGLALAGANHRQFAAPGEEDGILTAEEIAALDLRRTDWAVLSACDTGKGRLEPGEGVLGLRRAFRIAGARTLVLSLWALDDQAARTWIRELYTARWQRGSGALSAWNEATRTVLESRRRAKATVHPFYWAGFVATGDWR